MRDLAKKRYGDARRGAIARGIPWEITEKEWIDWWLSHGVDKSLPILPKATGATLAMCRYNDAGPYRLDNIYCDTMTNNNLHSWQWNRDRRTAAFKGQNSKRIKTPLGIFDSRHAAAAAHNKSPEALGYWIKHRPNDYYYL